MKIPPVKKLIIYMNDVVVDRGGGGGGTKHERGDIVEFSEKSRKRLAFVASNTHVVFQSMITLTYPSNYESDGKVVKKHLQSMLQKLERREGKISYLWFLEFQARGAPHFHLLLNILAGDFAWVAATWYLLVDSGDYKHLQAGTRWENMRRPGARYAVKYAMKMRQKAVPENYRNVGRFFGYSTDVEPQPIVEVIAGDLESIFKGVEYGDRCVENGWRVVYNASGKVMENIINEQ